MTKHDCIWYQEQIQGRQSTTQQHNTTARKTGTLQTCVAIHKTNMTQRTSNARLCDAAEFREKTKRVSHTPFSRA